MLLAFVCHHSFTSNVFTDKPSDLNGDSILFICYLHQCYCFLLYLHVYWCSFMLFRSGCYSSSLLQLSHGNWQGEQVQRWMLLDCTGQTPSSLDLLLPELHIWTLKSLILFVVLLRTH